MHYNSETPMEWRTLLLENELTKLRNLLSKEIVNHAKNLNESLSSMSEKELKFFLDDNKELVKMLVSKLEVK